MSRVKTFDSTGVATSGRLYAGDLNSIQDQYADLFNLGQTVGIGALQIGETALQLLRYGTGEARLSGALRADGIVRALGGLYVGAFTTAQRDAIASANRPYGIVILNTTTNRLEINLGTNTTPVWQPLGAGSVSRGTLGAIPAASTGNANTFYLATDDDGGTLYYSDGTAWVKVAPGINEQMVPIDGSVTSAKIADGTIAVGDLSSGVQSALMFTGVVLDYAGATAPPGWLLCDGSAVSRATYTDLFAIIGTRYGVGDGSSTFNVPDFRGRVAVGLGPNAAVDTLGDNEGVATAANRRPQHRHTPHTHTYVQPSTFNAASAGTAGIASTYPTGNTGAADGGSGNSNDPLDSPAFLVVNKIIKT